jgi:hypothetical protein
MSRWMILSLVMVMVMVMVSGLAAAQSTGYYEPLRYRADDPFVFCTQGQDKNKYPDRCWWPLPPYTGNFMPDPTCNPPNQYGRSWTKADWDSLAQYQRVCPQARQNGDWEGRQPAEQTPVVH